ncbi:MAG: hypothetical protein Q8P73_03290 [bacterium]|nr:hypothetical protein [bacterium]
MAGQVMDGFADDPTNGANHYYDVTQNYTPTWVDDDKFVIQINTVRFYRL